MINPYAPPKTGDTADAQLARRKSWLDLTLTLALLFFLGPSLLLTALAVYERSAGLGIYDPALGGDPRLFERSPLVPIVVACVALGRLALFRPWPIARRYVAAMLTIAILAVLAMATPRLIAPSFYGPDAK